jgi:hypothetical protein
MAAAIRYQQVMEHRDAAIDNELDRLIKPSREEGTEMARKPTDPS